MLSCNINTLGKPSCGADETTVGIFALVTGNSRGHARRLPSPSERPARRGYWPKRKARLELAQRTEELEDLKQEIPVCEHAHHPTTIDDE